MGKQAQYVEHGKWHIFLTDHGAYPRDLLLDPGWADHIEVLTWLQRTIALTVTKALLREGYDAAGPKTTVYTGNAPAPNDAGLEVVSAEVSTFHRFTWEYLDRVDRSVIAETIAQQHLDRCEGPGPFVFRLDNE